MQGGEEHLKNILRNAKQKSAQNAVDVYVKSNMVLGIGSGTTIVYAVHYLAQKIEKKDLIDIVCIPTSYQSLMLIKQCKLKLGDLTDYPIIDLTIDGADEVDKNTLTLIKGGGGCHLQEKVIAQCSKELVIIVDESKISPKIGVNFMVPVEFIPFAQSPIQQKLKDLKGFGTIKEVRLRESNGSKAGPCITDNGNMIFDIHFDGGVENPEGLEKEINQIAGVVAVGIFCGLAKHVVTGKFDGTVDTLNFPPNPNPAVSDIASEDVSANINNNEDE